MSPGRSARDEFLSLSPPERRIVHDVLVEQALARWKAHAGKEGEIRYRETVVGTEQIVDASLPEDAVGAVRSGQGADAVERRYGEPVAAMQDNDLSFPDAVEFAYYAILNYFRKYALQRDVDDWLIVNQGGLLGGRTGVGGHPAEGDPEGTAANGRAVRERIEVTTEVGVVALGDSQAVLPSGLDQDALLRQLEPMAHSGALFFLVTDDPVTYRVDLVAGEPSPPAPDPDFEGLGGVFRLDVPSGRVALIGWDKSGRPAEAGAISLPPGGAQRVSVLTRRPFDGPRHVKEMRELLGAEWDYMQKVNKLGLVGCLPLALTAMLILARQWHWLLYVVPLAAASWLPFFVLKRGERYKAAERRSLDHEKARAHYVIALTASRETDLAGGFLRV